MNVRNVVSKLKRYGTYMPRPLKAVLVGGLMSIATFVPIHLNTVGASTDGHIAAVINCGFESLIGRSATAADLTTWQPIYEASPDGYVFGQKLLATPEAAARTSATPTDIFLEQSYSKCTGSSISTTDMAYWNARSELTAFRARVFNYLSRQPDLVAAPALTTPAVETPQVPPTPVAPTAPTPPVVPTPITPTAPTTPAPPAETPIATDTHGRAIKNGIPTFFFTRDTVVADNGTTSTADGRTIKGTPPTFAPPVDEPCKGFTKGGSITPICHSGSAGTSNDVVTMAVPGSNITVNKAFYDNVVAFRAAASAAGYDLQATPVSGPYPGAGSFRTAAAQQWMRDHNSYAAKGTSMHQWGLAIDLRCNGASLSSNPGGCFTWVKKNAATYGIYNAIIGYEPWHWSTTGH